ncbi:pickpocket protein 28-like [Chironomus tepperi]|uniref:pickpocket protein 28-like n=1 Tax=Chironomus tepperi TaxID=113505 RepID=UPI00391F498C
MTERYNMVIKMNANFKSDSFYPQIRRKYFTKLDWFSFVGGILGLFFGFSFLSGFEIIFHIFSSVHGRVSQATTHSGRFKSHKLNKIVKYLKNFMNSSSIHSFSYVVDHRLRLYERLSWLISFIVSIYVCIFMIRELHMKLTIDSVAIVVSNKLVNLNDIPFPTVTVMTMMAFDLLVGHESEDLGLVEELVLRVSRNTQSSQFHEPFIKKSLLNITGYGHKIVPILRKYASKSIRNQLSFTWDGQYAVPTAQVLTTMAFGYSFNIADFDDIFEESRITSDFFYDRSYHFKGGDRNRSESYPWMSLYNSRDILEIITNDIYFPPFIYLHSPYEYPIQFQKEQLNEFEMAVSFSYEILIIPEIISTDEEVLSLRLNQRQCFMDGERKLIYFKIYSQRNCEIECLADKILRICSCVPFDIVRNNSTKICELFDYICVHKVKNEILLDIESQTACNCLQPCNLITYNYEFVEIKHPQDSMSTESAIKMKFKDNEFISLQRIRQFTIFDFLSYIGGLLGLFAGISVLSIFEIFYFFSLKLICEILRGFNRINRVGNGNTVMVVPVNPDKSNSG